MARTGRQKSESGVYHILLRGVDKLFIEAPDYIEFRARLSEYFSADVKLLAYLLLPNRVHLVIDSGDNDLSIALKPFCTSYARYFNRTYSIDGKLFYDRYKSSPCNTAADIADTVAFINAIGKNFAEREYFSLYEYETSAVICDTQRLTRLIGSSVTSLKPVSLHLDDYSQLSHEEMNVYLGIIANCTLDDLAKADRQQDSFKIIFSGSVSARAVLPLFGIHTAPSAKKAAAPKAKVEAPKEPEPAPKPAEKKSLSVWLL
ncbi:MAG: hypothetical protein KIG65_02480 [Eubacteriales bacterium]|nr:hypothetical protein [Eubacteriales bacterium]